MSHREFAVKHASFILKAISNFQCVEELVSSLSKRRVPPEIQKQITDYLLRSHSALVYSSLLRREKVRYYSVNSETFRDNFRVYIRKRPLFGFETNEGLYDITDISGGGRCLHVHDGKMARSGRLITMTHKAYIADRVFGDRADEKEFCAEVVGPLLDSAVNNRGNSTLLCFGQTGTGKTHTLKNALHYICSNLPESSVELSFFELHGKKCYDLLNNRRLLHLRENEFGETIVQGQNCCSFQLDDREGLVSALRAALELRSSTVTERNPNSSRSHAVCTITFGEKNGSLRRGCLTLVDLAGSERNYETVRMTAAMHKER